MPIREKRVFEASDGANGLTVAALPPVASRSLERRKRKRWEQHWRKFGAMSAAARATQAARIRDHPSQTLLSFSRVRVPPTFCTWSYPEPASGRPRLAEALSAWGALETARAGRRDRRDFTERRETSGGGHPTQRGREQAGWRAAGGGEPTCGHSLSAELGNSQPLPSGDRRDVGLNDLFNPLPKRRTWVLWGNCHSSTWQEKMWLWSQVDLGLVIV